MPVLNLTDSYNGDTEMIKGILSGSVKIKEIDESCCKKVKEAWDRAAKPLDSLGKFEDMTVLAGGILGKVDLSFKKRAIASFCADNGVVAENISQSGQEVTLAVSKAMGRREANVAKMAALTGTGFFPIDIGINTDETLEGVINRKVSKGTKNFAKEPAMSEEECLLALQYGIDIARDLFFQGYEMIAIGEMGIGNTTTTAAVASALLKVSPKEIAGKGAGLSNAGVIHKAEVIRLAIEKYDLENKPPFEVLRHVGGLDIAGMTGVVLGGAVYGIPIVLDGVISAVCALVAERILPGAGKRTIPSHSSKEIASSYIYKELGLEPVIFANMALGEGTGAAMLFALLDHAMAIYTAPMTFGDIDVEAYTRFDK